MSVFCIVRGGLGNQLFMIVTAITYSRAHNKELYCVFDANETRYNHFNLPTFIDGSQFDLFDNAIMYCEDSIDLRYREIPYVEGSIILTGYFQSSKYFDKNLIDTINIPKTISFSIPQFEGTGVCIHIRRTDYIDSNDFHPVQDIDYYNQAISIINDKIESPHYLIFSDDIEYITEHICDYRGIKNYTIMNYVDVDCLNIMKEFRHFIIANSSFSWWGAMLGGYETVIAPRKWFGKGGPTFWNDIYEDDWIVI